MSITQEITRDNLKPSGEHGQAALKLAGTFSRTLVKVAIYALAVGLIWELVYLIMVQWFQVWVAALFPSPLEVLTAIADHLADGTLPRATFASFNRLLIGFGISLPLGVLMGLGLSGKGWFKKAVGPLVLGFQALPRICWLPLAILWFGLNERSIIFVVVMGSVFSVTIATYDGTKLISPLQLRAAHNMGVKGWGLFWRVVLPAALPAILGGARQGWSFAWRSLLAGELLTAGIGLGNLLNQGRDLTDMPLVMAVMVVIITLGLAVDQLVLNKVERAISLRYGLAQHN
ncbi:MAG TPA: ABC transporter permease [Chloroflexia bacterium]|nr:ABC transporter permease [Chloroflexia bacterium]